MKDGEEESPEEEHEMEQEKPKQRVHSLSSSDNDDQDGDDTLQKKEVCAQRKVPAKHFKICYISCIQKLIWLGTFFEKSLRFSAKLNMVLRKDLAKFEPFLCKTGLV